MTDQELETLFGGAPRPPFGLYTPTKTVTRTVYLADVGQKQREEAIARILTEWTARRLTLDERFGVAAAHLLLFQKQLDYCGSAGPSDGGVVSVDAEIEVIDDPTGELAAELARRTREILTGTGPVSVDTHEAIRDSFGAIFCSDLQDCGSLPRIAAFS